MFEINIQAKGKGPQKPPEWSFADVAKYYSAATNTVTIPLNEVPKGVVLNWDAYQYFVLDKKAELSFV